MLHKELTLGTNSQELNHNYIFQIQADIPSCPFSPDTSKIAGTAINTLG